MNERPVSVKVLDNVTIKSSEVFEIPPDTAGSGDQMAVEFQAGSRRWYVLLPIPCLATGFRMAAMVFQGARCLVVAGGRGYFIDPNSPGDYRLISPWPIYHVHDSEDTGSLFIVGADSMSMYVGDQQRWETDRLVIDDLKIIDVDDTSVLCEGYVPHDYHHRFRVRRADGKIEGGACLLGSKDR